MNDNNTIDILSIKISLNNLEETMVKMAKWIDSKQKKRICVTPVNCIVWAQKDKYLKNIYNTSDMNLADGVPLLWASKFLGKEIKGRVTGLDLLPKFTKIASENNYKYFFLGAKEGVAEKLKDKLKEKFPKIDVVGVYSPPFMEKFTKKENQKIIEMINSTKPNVLWVSLTAPKQDYWIFENISKLDVNIAIGVGGAFEVSADIIRRAPIWMQKYGLEWFYRFLQEPKRLFKRYFWEAPIFIPLVLLQKIGILYED